jgi:NAD(P)-dependent dehydrogenase (short-subunit alcohol dehydrogenase family)
LEVNLTGYFLCAREAARVMIEQKKGKIINISSQSGQVGLPQRAAYCASKGGVIMVAKALAFEVAKFGINVNCISPGNTATP